MIRTQRTFTVGSALALIVAATAGCQGTAHMRITQEPWGTHDGSDVNLYTLDNGSGMIARITNYGGIITQLFVPDSQGEAEDIVLGFDTLQEYVESNPYFGAMVGRVGNRIALGQFELDGKQYQLATNNGPNHLHGGAKGFDKVVWNAQELNAKDGPGLRLTYQSPDGEEGYPGTVDITVDYVLTFDNELRVQMSATTDAPTPINIVHHTYWNLGGHDSGTILDHMLQLDAAHYTPADATFIPTGDITSVRQTPFDFTLRRRIGANIGKLPVQGDNPGGYDLNYIIDGFDETLRRAAKVIHLTSGRTMEIWTTMPGIQFYSGNFLDGVAGKNGSNYAKHNGFCLETQYFPDAINKRGRAGWPNAVLRPGETYRHVMVHRFGR